MKKISLTLVGLMTSALFAHNVGEHGTGSEGILHYLTEWHHGGQLWIVAALMVLGTSCFMIMNKRSGR